MFPKLDPKLASSAYYIGDNLGLHKLIRTFFGTISSKHINYFFMGQNWDMLTPTLTVLGCTRHGYSWAKAWYILRVNFISCNYQCMFPKVVPK